MRKRILSFVLALSMTVSLFPAGALAQSAPGGIATQGVGIGSETGSTGTAIGNGLEIDTETGKPSSSGDGTNWSWSSSTDTLTLLNGTYNFGTYANAAALNCKVVVKSGVTVTGGEYGQKVTVEDSGKIENGVFYYTTNNKSAPATGNNVTGIVYFGGDNIHAGGASYLNLAGIKTLNGVDMTNYMTEYNDYGVGGLIGVYPNTEVKAVINDGVEVVNLNGVLVSDTDGLQQKYAASYDATSKTFTFTMPSDSMQVNKTASLSVTGGSANTSSAIVGTSVTVTADADTADKMFTGWTAEAYDESGSHKVTVQLDIANGGSLSDREFTFTMPKQRVLYLTAHYKTALVIDDSTGLPKNENTDETQGWTYTTGETGAKVLTLYADQNFSTYANATKLNCKVVVKNGVTVTGGEYLVQPEVEQGGKIENGVFYYHDDFYLNGLKTTPENDDNVTGVVCSDWNIESSVKALKFNYLDDKLGKIKNVNGMNLTSYTTAFTAYPGTEVTVEAENVIYNLNGVLIEKSADVDYVGTDKKTVKFTMPGENAFLNQNATLSVTRGTAKVNNGTEDLLQKGDIYSGQAMVGLSVTATADPETGDETFTGWTAQKFGTYPDKVNVTLYDADGNAVDLKAKEIAFIMPANEVMLTANYKVPTYNSKLEIGDDGKPDLTNADKDPAISLYRGDGWTYDENNHKLTLTANPTGETCWDFQSSPALTCAVVVGDGVLLNNGTFDGEVENNGTIELGTYNKKVTNNGTIKNSAVFYEVENTSTGIIEHGMFKGKVVNSGTIKGGTFKGEVTNDGAINGGVFASGVTNNGTSAITSGAFVVADGETPPEGAQPITLEGGSLNEVDDLTVYSGTVYAMPGTKVTVRANGVEFAKLNGKAIGADNCNSSVDPDTGRLSFDMPNGKVVLEKKTDPKPTEPTEPTEPTDPDKPKPEEPKPEEPKAAEYTIKVDEYAKVNGKDTVTVKEGDTVSLTVSETPDGQTFDYWDLPSELQEELTKQDSTFNNKVQNLSFRMPKMGDKDASFSIKTGFRSAELPGDEEGPSALGTAAIVAVGGATAGVLVWQGVSLGVDSYLQLNLPDGVPVPTNRRELVKLLWETAGKPEVALPALYDDVPAEDVAQQKASRWAEEAGLVKAADDKDASRFDPDHYVTKMDVFGAWLKLQKLLKNK